MHKLDWSDIHHFLEVVKSGSAIQAAHRLGVNHSTVYRRITALEKQLGKNLFERLSSGWVITPLGERLIAYAESMAENANNIERQIMADNHEVSGLLRITAADHCIETLMMPVIKTFTQSYPEVDLEVIATADELNLGAREADIALRGTNEPPANLLGKRITSIAFSIYATSFLKEYALANPLAEDIPCITWVGDGHSRPNWIEKNFPNTKRIYRTTSVSTMFSMVKQGIGLSYLSCILGDPEPNLQRIWIDYVKSTIGLWVLSHVDLRTTARVRIFRDFLVEGLEKQKKLIEGKLIHDF